MFPPFNFSTTRCNPNRRTVVDGFGQVSAVASDVDGEIISQRLWQPSAPSLVKLVNKRVFRKESNPIDFLSEFRSKNRLVEDTLKSLQCYRGKVASNAALRDHCRLLASTSSASDDVLHNINTGGVVVDGLVSSQWITNLPLYDSKLFSTDFVSQCLDFGSGALAAFPHPNDSASIVLAYPSPTEKRQLRFAGLHEKGGHFHGSFRFNVPLPNCDPREITTSGSALIVNGGQVVTFVDLSRLDGRPRSVVVAASQSTVDNNFRTRVDSTALGTDISTEALVSSRDGDVRLWDLETSHLRRLFIGEERFDDGPSDSESFSQALFGSHPRLVIQANRTGAFLWDIRRRARCRDLLTLPHSSVLPNERVCRVLRSRIDPFAWYVATSRSLLVVDERIPNVPTADLKHSLLRRPVYGAVAQLDGGEAVALASQSPWEINAIVFDRENPTMPWRINDSFKTLSGPATDNSPINDGRKTALIGLSCLPSAVGGESAGSSLWQLSSLGEVFRIDMRESDSKKEFAKNIPVDFNETSVLETVVETSDIMDASLAWAVVTREEDSLPESQCLFCKTRGADWTSFTRWDRDDEADDACRRCGMERLSSEALHEARLTSGFVRDVGLATHDAAELAFKRMTLKEEFAPESKIFTLNRDNILSFLSTQGKGLGFDDDEEDVDSLDTDLAIFSRSSFCGSDRRRRSTPASQKRGSSNDESLSMSPGFGMTPKRLRRRVARCLWNPFFLENGLIDPEAATRSWASSRGRLFEKYRSESSIIEQSQANDSVTLNSDFVESSGPLKSEDRGIDSQETFFSSGSGVSPEVLASQETHTSVGADIASGDNQETRGCSMLLTPDVRMKDEPSISLMKRLADGGTGEDGLSRVHHREIDREIVDPEEQTFNKTEIQSSFPRPKNKLKAVRRTKQVAGF